MHNDTEYLLPEEAALFLGLSLDQFKHRLYRLKLVPIARRCRRTPLFLAYELEAKRDAIISGRAKVA